MLHTRAMKMFDLYILYYKLWQDVEHVREQGAFGSRKLFTDLIEHKIDEIAQITAEITHWKNLAIRYI